MKIDRVLDYQDAVYSAIRLDLDKLRGSGHAGAVHFAGVMTFNPYHLNHLSDFRSAIRNTSADIAVDDSALFICAEAIRLALSGDRDESIRSLQSVGHLNDGDKLLILLVTAWLNPTPVTLDAVGSYMEDVTWLPREMRSRIYLQLMTWTRAVSGLDESAVYYDRALSYASGDLKKAIYSIGTEFERESHLYFEPLKRKLVRYDFIMDSVDSAAKEEFHRQAKRKIQSPFTRTFGARTGSLPDSVVAAELQAEWAGAYWVLRRVWRAKASIALVLSVEPTEIANAIVEWVLSDGSNIKNLIEANEHYLSSDLIDVILKERLLYGARVPRRDWIELCDGMTDLLPVEIAENVLGTLASTLNGSFVRGKNPSEDRIIELFARLYSVAPTGWVREFEALDDAVQGVISAALRPKDVSTLPPLLKGLVRRNLLAVLEQDDVERYVLHNVVFNLATLTADLSSTSTERNWFVERIPVEFSATVALNYPEFTRSDLIEEYLLGEVKRLDLEMNANQTGSWSSFSQSLPQGIAQALIALNRTDSAAIGGLRALAVAPSSSSDDVIDSVRALTWLHDAGLLSDSDSWVNDIEYRAAQTAPDMHWQGRDNVRAMNAMIAGFRLRHHAYGADSMERLAFAARDPDVQVRLLSLEQLSGGSVKLAITEQQLFDTIAVGAVFDPDSRVQAAAFRLVDRIAEASLRELSLARITKEWNTTHRRVRYAAVDFALRDSNSERLRGLIARAKSDPSALVRNLVSKA